MINKIISTKCIGYSADFSQSHYQTLAMVSGERRTTYQTIHKDKELGYAIGGYLTKAKPYVEVPLTFCQPYKDGM